MKLSLAIVSVWIFAAQTTTQILCWHVSGRRP